MAPPPPPPQQRAAAGNYILYSFCSNLSALSLCLHQECFLSTLLLKRLVFLEVIIVSCHTSRCDHNLKCFNLHYNIFQSDRFIIFIRFVMDAESENLKPDNFCLKWSDYQDHVLSVLVQLLEAESMVDVTLCTSTGYKLHAHKIVLCAASSYFEEIFADSAESHPILILSEVDTKVLQCILNFVYHGELNVQASQLTEVLQVAASLQIRGLSEVCDQLPQLVPSFTERAPPEDDNFTSSGSNEEPCSLPESLSQPTVASCSSDKHPQTASDFDCANAASIQEESIEHGVEESQNAQKHETQYMDLTSSALKENCNKQCENWTMDDSYVNDQIQEHKRRKRRESCRKEYSEEQLATALKDLKSGQLLRETASTHNIPRSTLYVRAKAEGIPITVSRQEHSGDNVSAAVEAVNRGASLHQASAMYQIPKTVLWRRVRAAGGSTSRLCSKRQSYDPSHWQAAVQALQDGQKLSKVSAQFHIPKTTLFREKERLVQAGKLPWTSLKKRDPQLHPTKNSRLKEAVAACQEGKMSQAVASITYQVPKTTIWRGLQRGLQQSSDNKSVRSVEVTNTGVGNPVSEQAQFSFIEGNNQLPVTYIVEEDFSSTALIIE